MNRKRNSKMGRDFNFKNVVRNATDKFSALFGLRLLDDGIKFKTDITVLLTRNGIPFDTIPVGSNIITDSGKSNMAHLLVGDDTANRQVITMAWSDEGHNPLSPTSPTPPLATNTELYGDTILSKSVTYSFPAGSSGTSVQLEASIEENEGNGSGSQAYSEVGLFDVTGRLIGHKTFGLITKTNAFGMIFRYTIQF